MAQQPPAPPPPPPTGPSGGAYGARPGSVTGAGILLIILGSLRGLLGLIALIAILGATEEITDELGGGALTIGIVSVLIALIVGLLQILGGVNTLRLRRRGFVLGLTGSIIGVILVLLGLVSGTAAAGGLALVVAVLVLLGDIAAIIMLTQSSRYLTQA